MWFDGTNYWRATFDPDNSIIFEYSTEGRLGVDPDDWTENVAARISDVGVSTDFSVRGDTSYCFVVYSDGTDIRGRKAKSYPAANFQWLGSAVVTFDGSDDGGTYSHCDIAKDGNSARLNVAAILYTTGTGKYSCHVKRAGSGNVIPPKSAADKQLSDNWDILGGVSIRRGPDGTNGSLIAVWRRDGEFIESAYRDGTGVGDWEGEQTIATSKTGDKYGFSMEHGQDEGYTVLGYINAAGRAAHRRRSAGSAQAWGAEEVIDTNTGCNHIALGEHALGDFHFVWLDSDDALRHREHDEEGDIWSPAIDPYDEPEDLGTKTGALGVSLSDETPINIAIWQIGGTIYSQVVDDNEIPLAPSSLECEGQTDPTGVTDTTPEFTGIYNANGDTDEAIRCQIEIRDDGGSFIAVFEDTNLDAAAGISTAVVGLQTGHIECYSLGGVSGGSPADYLGILDDNIYTDGDTLDAAKPLYIDINSGASCNAGDTLTIKLGDASTLTVYLPEITAGDLVHLYITDDGSTWYGACYCRPGQVNPSIPWLSGEITFAAPVSDTARCEEISSTNEFALNGDKYYWKMRMQDDVMAWGAWSDGTDNFTMQSSSSSSSSSSA